MAGTLVELIGLLTTSKFIARIDVKKKFLILFLGINHLYSQNEIRSILREDGYNLPITSSILDLESSFFYPSKISNVEGQELLFGVYDSPFKNYWDFYFPFYYMGYLSVEVVEFF